MKFAINVAVLCLWVVTLAAAIKVTALTVVDEDNRLEWQMENPGKMRWRDGINYCKLLALNNQTDWRLPNKKELELGSKLAKHFKELNPVFFWTSTDYEQDKEKSWVVNLVYGFLAYDNGGFAYDVKCVRTYP